MGVERNGCIIQGLCAQAYICELKSMISHQGNGHLPHLNFSLVLIKRLMFCLSISKNPVFTKSHSEYQSAAGYVLTATTLAL